ncbi:MAG: IS200/IS605 family transposase [Chloroflexales bacterium]|nr:IS200/IS605 family transposase [Chloroflexales bacterium]
MSSTRYKQHAGGVSTLHDHFVWCPKYRRKVLQGAIADRLKALLHEKADALGVTVEGLEVLPDHVHLFVAASPTDAPQYLANQFKGYTSRVLRDEFPGLKSRLPSLWRRSYSVGSAGHVSADTIQKYIAQQKRS